MFNVRAVVSIEGLKATNTKQRSVCNTRPHPRAPAAAGPAPRNFEEGELGSDKCARTFFAQTGTSRQNSRDIPDSSLSKPKLSRDGTNSSVTTSSRGRPPPHRAVSGPKRGKDPQRPHFHWSNRKEPQGGGGCPSGTASKRNA